MKKYYRTVNTAITVFLISVGSIVLASCRRPSLPAIEMARVKQLMAEQGRLEWFSANARAAIRSKDEQDKIIQQIDSQMPSLEGRAAFSCWIQKARSTREEITGQDILVGDWRANVSATGIMVGSSDFVPSPPAWPRHRFEKLTNGVYVFYTFN